VTGQDRASESRLPGVTALLRSTAIKAADLAVDATGTYFGAPRFLTDILKHRAGQICATHFDLVAQDVLARQNSKLETSRIVETLLDGLKEVERIGREGDPRFLLREELANAESATTDAFREIVEGAIIHAQECYENKKRRHIGIFFARYAFMGSVDAPDAHHLLTTLRMLTFRQLCWLRIAKTRPRTLPQRDYRDMGTGPHNLATLSLLQEAIGLQTLGLVVRDDNYSMLDASDVKPSALTLSLMGQALEALAGLERIEQAELQKVVQVLTSDGTLADRS
jgi:hypothetical protein